MDIKFSIPNVDIDQVVAAARARHAAAKIECTRDGRFVGASLGAWLTHVQAAGIPHVPAKLLTSVPRNTFLRIETPEPGDEALWEETSQQLSSLPARYMARWDHCSSLDLKAALAEGRMPDPDEATTLSPWDPRAFELSMLYPADDIVIWARPWIAAEMVDGYPLEFRVFVQDDKVVGVSSYYPQRALPASDYVLGCAEECRVLSEHLIAHMSGTGMRPWMPDFEGKFDPDAVSATLDFLVTKTGEVLFLEAGPPYGAGAHPCAFIDRPIAGVALQLALDVELR